MKRFLAISLIVSVVFIACNGNKNPGTTQAQTSPEQAGRKYTSLPFGDKTKTKLTVFTTGIEMTVTSFDYGKNTMTNKVVDDSGVMMEFVAPSSDKSERLNVLLNTGDYPEMILGYGAGIGRSGMEYYASQGIFIPLDDYHVMDYPNIAAMFKEYPALNEIMRGTDGKLYALPGVNDCIQCTYGSGRSWFYMPWIRDTGLKVPETLDEFTDLLRLIRDNDVNGNGNKNDEIPMIFASGDLGNMITFFARSYMPWISGGLALYEGTVTEQYRMDEFRQCLAYITGLYKEGLIKEDSFTMTGDQRNGFVRSEVPVAGTIMSSWMNTVVVPTGQRFAEMRPLPMLKGPGGQRWGSNDSPWSILEYGAFITDKCKDPELVIALYDYMLNWYIMCEDYGPKGTGWDDPDPGAPNLVGGPAMYKFLAGRDTGIENNGWNQRNPSYRNLKFRQGQQSSNAKQMVEWIDTWNPALLNVAATDPDYIEVMFNYTPLVNEPIKIPQEYFIPSLVMSEPDTNRVADIRAVLNPYKNQAWVEFITGKRNINNDADWNAYLADLDRIGSKELVSIYQKYVK